MIVIYDELYRSADTMSEILRERKPATENQLNRIRELLEIPGMASYVYDDMGVQRFAKLLETQRGTGYLIGVMKKRAAL